jgi:4-carboxymuconolactone decarboxylase
MSEDDRLERGKETFKKVYGSILKVPEKTTAFTNLTLTTLFSEVWSRNILSMRDKRLLILGTIAGQGADPSLFEIHTRSALANGELQYVDLEEICMLLIFYCGFPHTSPIYLVCQKILADRDKATSK